MHVARRGAAAFAYVKASLVWWVSRAVVRATVVVIG